MNKNNDEYSNCCFLNMCRGREHLTFFAQLKGLSGQSLADAVNFRLNQVDLLRDGDRFAGQYSGTNKGHSLFDIIYCYYNINFNFCAAYLCNYKQIQAV